MLGKKYQLGKRTFQRGQGMFQIIAFIALGGIVLASVLKLGPHYISNYTIRDILIGVKEDRELAKLKNNKIKLKVRSRFAANSIRGQAQDSIVVSRDDGVITVSAKYEERIPFIYNIDVILKFSNQVEFEEVK